MIDADLLNAYRGVIDLALAGEKLLVLIPANGVERLRDVAPEILPIERENVCWDSLVALDGTGTDYGRTVKRRAAEGYVRVIDLRTL